MEKKHSVSKICIILISAAVILATAFLVFNYFYVQNARKTAHERITGYIDADLIYDEAAYDDEIAQLLEMTSLTYAPDSDRGHAYERLAQIYKFRGDTLNFYHTLGTALYYLDKGGNKDVAVNIYEDIANYYITDCNFRQAQIILDEMYEKYDIQTITDPQVKSYAYRMRAITARNDGRLEEAVDMIRESDIPVNDNPDAVWVPSYRAINDMVLAGIYVDEKKYDGAQELIDKYADSEFFTATIYADIITRDFVLPYYDVACSLAAVNGDEVLLGRLMDECQNYSEKYGFLKKELDIFDRVRALQGALSEQTLERIRKRELGIYEKVTNIQSDEYAAMIHSPLEAGMREQELIEQERQNYIKNLRKYIIVSVIIIIMICVITMILTNSLTDALTRVGNRRSLNYYLSLLALVNRKYSVIMMDIDDFKKVNDTYGHDMGDLVLMRIGSLLGHMQSRHNRSFRYGGEEFVMIVDGLERSASIRLAENIRRDIAWQSWEFDRKITVSMGIAFDMTGEQAIKQADENMYHSKTHGKNAVTYLENGEKIIFTEQNE